VPNADHHHWIAALLAVLIVGMCGVAGAAPVEPSLPTTGWLLDEGSGTDLAEIYGHRTGELAGATLPAWSTDTPFAYAGNSCLSFTGSGYSQGNYAKLDGYFSGTRGTIAFWITDDDSSLPRYIMDASDGSRTLIYRSGGDFSVYLNQSSIGSVSNSLTPKDNSWTHVAMVWDNDATDGKQKFYKNGTLFATLNNVSVSARNPASIYLGSRFTGDEAWGGKMDEFAYWNQPLASDEVEWLATNSLSTITVPPMTKPQNPVSAWRFDEKSGSTAHDAFGTNDGTLMSNVTHAANAPFSYPGNTALYFDGTLDNRVNFGPHTFGTEGSIQVWAYREGGARYLFDSSSGARTLLYSTFSLYLNNQSVGSIPNLLDDNRWTHLVITWDNADAGTRQKYYKNGELFHTTDYTLSSRSPAMLWLGNRYSNNEPWRGAIDEYALWDYALSPDEVSWLRHNSIVPEPTTMAVLGLGLIGLARRRRRS